MWFILNYKIFKSDDFGRGITYVDDKITFVTGATVGDIVELEVTSRKRKFNEAVVKRIIRQSELREKPLCPYFSLCGGCVLQNITYDAGISYKSKKVIDYFKKNNVAINPIVIDCNQYKYRNKITLKVVNGVIGYYQSKSHKVIKIDSCVIAKDVINEMISEVAKFNIVNGEIIIRCNANNDVLISIYSSDLLDVDLKNISPKIVGIVVNDKTIYKDNYFYERVNGFKFKVSYNSFFQVNLDVASKLFKLIDDFIDKDDIVLDLYSGVGTFSLSASKALRVYGVEIVKNAVLNAKENVILNKRENVEFILSDASAVLDIDFAFNKLIVDPPRAGLNKDVIEFINKKKPEIIIYVSCDYHTQVRDIKLLENYEIVKSYIGDMFPFTYHVECVVVLRYKGIK